MCTRRSMPRGGRSGIRLRKENHGPGPWPLDDASISAQSYGSSANLRCPLARSEMRQNGLVVSTFHSSRLAGPGCAVSMSAPFRGRRGPVPGPRRPPSRQPDAALRPQRLSTARAENRDARSPLGAVAPRPTAEEAHARWVVASGSGFPGFVARPMRRTLIDRRKSRVLRSVAASVIFRGLRRMARGRGVGRGSEHPKRSSRQRGGSRALSSAVSLRVGRETSSRRS